MERATSSSPPRTLPPLSGPRRHVARVPALHDVWHFSAACILMPGTGTGSMARRRAANDAQEHALPKLGPPAAVASGGRRNSGGGLVSDGGAATGLRSKSALGIAGAPRARAAARRRAGDRRAPRVGDDVEDALLMPQSTQAAPAGPNAPGDLPGSPAWVAELMSQMMMRGITPALVFDGAGR